MHSKISAVYGPKFMFWNYIGDTSSLNSFIHFVNNSIRSQAICAKSRYRRKIIRKYAVFRLSVSWTVVFKSGLGLLPYVWQSLVEFRSVTYEDCVEEKKEPEQNTLCSKK